MAKLNISPVTCMPQTVCNINFRNGEKIPQQYNSDSTKYLFKDTILGRPQKSIQLEAFDETCNYLESIEGQSTSGGSRLGIWGFIPNQ